MGCVGHVACMQEMRNEYKYLVGKSERKTPLGRSYGNRRVISKWIIKK
jgi:hypothetical protein